MNDNQAILIRMPAESGALTTWLDGGMSDTATLDEIAPRTSGRRCTVLVPGGQVLLTDATLPTRNRQRMHKAVPYALEEQLIDDVEAQHFALGNAPANSPVPVAVVSQETMNGWLETLQQAGIRPDALMPDTLALPWQPGDWTLGIESGPDGPRWLLRCGEYQGFSIEADTGVVMIQTLLNEADAVPPARLLICTTHEPPAALLGVCAEHDIPVEVRNAEYSLTELLNDQATPKINLLQGRFSRNEEFSRLWRPWRLGIALLAVWLVIATGIRIFDYQRLTQQRDDLRTQMETLYRQAVPSFPKDKAILDPRKLMERDLARLTGGGAGGPGFIDLIAKTGAILKQTPGLEIKSLRSQGGEMELDLQITDLQSLDQLKQALTGAAPVEVEIVSATSREGKVEGRLKIRSKS